MSSSPLSRRAFVAGTACAALLGSAFATAAGAATPAPPRLPPRPLLRTGPPGSTAG